MRHTESFIGVVAEFDNLAAKSRLVASSPKLLNFEQWVSGRQESLSLEDPQQVGTCLINWQNIQQALEGRPTSR